MSRRQSTSTPFSPADIKHRVLTSGRRAIKYGLSFRDRSTLQIDVFPDLTVAVVAPLEMPDSRVSEAVQSRANWIRKQLSDFQLIAPVLPSHEFKSGECFRYLGRQYKLKISNSKTESVKMQRGQLQVAVNDRKDHQRIQQLVEQWYQNKAEIIIDELWISCVSKIERFEIEPSGYRLRKMKTRWGSCGKSGVIQLNPELVTASKSCIEYVIFHELCHLKHFNHGAEFFELLEQLCPNWKSLREKLNMNVRSVA